MAVLGQTEQRLHQMQPLVRTQMFAVGDSDAFRQGECYLVLLLFACARATLAYLC